MEATALILCSGGQKAIAVLGAVYKLYLCGRLRSVNTYIGTSAGSCIAAMLAMKFSISEIAKIVISSDIKPEASIDNVFYKQGLIDAEKSFIGIIREAVNAKHGYMPTFADLHKKFGTRFCCVTVNLSTGLEEILSEETTPNLDIVSAAKLSSAVPFIFTSPKYKKCTYSDGALSNPLPITPALYTYPDIKKAIAVALDWHAVSTFAEIPVRYLSLRTARKYETDTRIELVTIKLTLSQSKTSVFCKERSAKSGLLIAGAQAVERFYKPL